MSATTSMANLMPGPVNSQLGTVTGLTAAVASSPLDDARTTNVDVAGHMLSPGVTTVPGVDPPLAGRRMSYAMPCPRSLGNTTLSIAEIDELFQM